MCLSESLLFFYLLSDLQSSFTQRLCFLIFSSLPIKHCQVVERRCHLHQTYTENKNIIILFLIRALLQGYQCFSKDTWNQERFTYRGKIMLHWVSVRGLWLISFKNFHDSSLKIEGRVTYSWMVHSKSFFSDCQRVVQQISCFFVFVLISEEKGKKTTHHFFDEVRCNERTLSESSLFIQV